MNRRKFFRDSAFASAGMVLGSRLLACSAGKKQEEPVIPLMREVMKYRKIDAHSHVGLHPGDEEELLDFADRLGIEKMCISRPITNYSGNEPEGPEEVKRVNDIIINAVKRHPDRFIGYLTLNPRYPKESIEEINRCVDQGITGYKGYTQVKINDPLYYPIIEKFIDLKMIMLMHAFCQLGMGGYRMKYDIGKWYNTSIPEDFVDISKRYPEAIFQFAHIGGGGDWEYECKMLKDSPNVYVDTSGSNNEESMIDFAVGILGEDRLFYGSDGSYYQSVGKILASNLKDTVKEKIFSGNYNRVLTKIGRNAV
jgi:uncharacterized protein